jgi:cytochrome d ubiquinol oxidase subunit II
MEMATLWYVLLAFMLITYVVLDGFDLGVGVLHLRLARSERERQHSLHSIGPVWDGNEVWLVAAGGTLYFAFPRLYAASFSGFYLALTLVLWCLCARALAVELRHHLDNPVWRPLWDAVFCAASAALTFMFGVALGNVVRGVSFGPDQQFFAPLWTDLRVGQEVGLLDWYTVLVGCHATVALALHGALWLRLRAEGTVAVRARSATTPLLCGTAVATVATTCATLAVQPLVWASLNSRPWGMVFPACALLGLAAIARYHRRDHSRAAFLGSAAHLAGMLASAAFGLYPYPLPGRLPGQGLHVAQVATAADTLQNALFWWLPGVGLALGYFWFLYRRLPDLPAHGDPHG